MPSRNAVVYPLGQYRPFRVNAIQAAITPVGAGVSTTSSTTITAGNGVVVAPASMKNIVTGMLLNVANGVGTPEDVRVLAITPTTFTANFLFSHSGAYTIISRRGTYFGGIWTNQPGSGVTLTFYNGHPSLLPVLTDSAAGILGAWQPGSLQPFPELACDYGLFYTASATTMGDFLLAYADMALG
jgi:hypothetical protein